MKKNKIPSHLAIIMDGNRRWAKKKNLPFFMGHQKGLKVAEKVVKWAKKMGIKILTLWAFSTENWKRSKREINYLIKLLEESLHPQSKYAKSLMEQKIRFKALGQIEKFPKKLQKRIKELERLTKKNKEGILNLALNYGGRAEILEAVKKIIKEKIPHFKINQKLFEKYLETGSLPPPDLIIRTGGEKRLSGFFSWQGAYSELYFSKKLWPDFTKKDLEKALQDFAKRERRFGR